ncbi:hypothetical protein CSUI_000582 [Cystoisospora suis]|uniref:Uncharacterized protein n=1 Tax=Cystoisospora suis TaxID=483139 RepID=A0A2C6LG52_9APIC|nr:hypothetical protein CSUI_000582 [Cystoisospora suis]
MSGRCDCMGDRWKAGYQILSSDAFTLSASFSCCYLSPGGVHVFLLLFRCPKGTEAVAAAADGLDAVFVARCSSPLPFRDAGFSKEVLISVSYKSQLCVSCHRSER